MNNRTDRQTTQNKKTTDARIGGAWTTYLAAAHGVLTGAGLSRLPIHEMAGMTGMAFQFIMHKHCDAAAVTVYDWVRRHQDALDRIGVLSEIYHYEPGAQTYEAARSRAVHQMKRSIDRGAGVIVWGVDTGEFGVVYGYDDEDGILMADGVHKFNRPLGSDPILYQNIGKTFAPAPFLHYQIPLESVEYDLEKSYADSLKFYVNEMDKEFHMAPDFKSGFLAYENWLHSLENGTYNPFGLRYCTTVYAESKCFAAEYLRTLEQTWGGIQGLKDISDHFNEIAGLYRSMMNVLEQDWDGGKHLGKAVAPEQAKRMIPLVQQAKELESRAVQLINEAL